ncbi:MAG: hypothetical protein HY794_11215 [Desulfarculus sp.]|nr:hypothetical protein [Desulfarculus sp.]
MGIIHAPAICCGPGLTGLGQARLYLFLSLGSSLADWRALGTLERETAIYRALLRHLAGVSLVSYGRHDRALAPELGGLTVLDNRLGLHPRLYQMLLKSGLTIRGQGPAVVKTNQMQGADLALKAARRAGHAFVARCGYLPSNIAIWREGTDSAEAQRWFRLEARVLNAADCAAHPGHPQLRGHRSLHPRRPRTQARRRGALRGALARGEEPGAPAPGHGGAKGRALAGG